MKKPVRQERVKCVFCGKETAGKMGVSWDPHYLYPRHHYINGVACPGNFEGGLPVEDKKNG